MGCLPRGAGIFLNQMRLLCSKKKVNDIASAAKHACRARLPVPQGWMREPQM
jgi:hypothetical protein